jgi:hypothetical protein
MFITLDSNSAQDRKRFRKLQAYIKVLGDIASGLPIADIPQPFQQAGWLF